MTPDPQPPPRPVSEGAVTVAWTGSTYFAEGLPWSVLHQIASEFFTAAGLPPSQVGYTSALHLTSSLKFLWSPIVDLFGTLRRWLIATQALLGLLMGVLAVLAHDLALGTGEKDTTFIWLTLIAIGVASATHDIACDGYYMDALDKDAQARHAGTRVAAFRVAMLVGNSGLVYLGGRHSWLLGFGLAGGLMLILAVVHRVLLPPSAGERSRRASKVPERSGAERAAHVRASYLSFLRQDRALVVVLFLLTYKLGDALMFNMSKVMLRDLGVSTAERGVINGFGTGASILGAMLGGAWIARSSLARAVVPITILMCATQPLYLLIAAPSLPMGAGNLADAPAYFTAWMAPSLTAITIIMIIEQLCGGMAVAAQMVFLMRRCHPDHKAAHFAFGTAIYAVSQMVTGTYSGWVYQAQGPLVYFALACVACIPCLVLVRWIPTR
ncbi:MAG: MFS transporter [Nannocystis sp.]|uniref:MFS transporter n=1 Tax=Nannocystis sp. TaxID=1962667 RepID=UPI0024280AFB|nr:MFS transporter [Nannocystis sp.]MBK9752834.1 MFS transporter [Nannocystis sp.]